MYRLIKEEQETNVSWSAAEDKASISTADPAVIRKLDRLAKAYPDVYKITRVDPNYNAKTYGVPARYIRFGKPASAAQKEASRKNAFLARQAL